MKSKKNISSFSVIVSFIALALIGISLLPLLPVKLAPSQNMPTINIRFSMHGNSARVVEMEATSKLESMLSRLKGIKQISSSSSNGRANITLSLDKYASIDVLRFEASNIIRQTWPSLPEGVSYPTISVRQSDDKSQRPFMVYTINSQAAPALIQQYAENIIKPRLSEIADIYKIEIKGASPMEWQLEYDNDELLSLGISSNDIAEAVRMHYHSEYLGMGEVEKKAEKKEWQRILLKTGDKEAPFDPSLITLKNNQGRLIQLHQLVKFSKREQTPTSYFRINGLNSIYLSITANESANQLVLSKTIEKSMLEIIKTLPAGYEIHNSYKASDYIQKELDKIYLRSGLTVLILLLFVLLITRNLSYLLLIAISLSINLAIGLIFFYLFGLEIQLYSLAGITISLSLIIDNSIIMTDHVMHKQNRTAFLPMLAATMTTIGALAIIFLLDERIRLNLQDFSAVVIVNLVVSLAVALFLVPALIEKTGLKKRKRSLLFKGFSPQRLVCRINSCYIAFIKLLCSHKWIPLLIILLFFGLPVFLIPDKIENKGKFAEQYNKVVAKESYRNKIKPLLNKTLGGTLRLFVDKVKTGSYYNRDNEETILHITATMPNGTSLEQMNNLIVRMESYLSKFSEIRQFQTNINSSRRASIQVFFHPSAEKSGFPYSLKSNVIGEALKLGGGSWGVYGLEDQGFSNDIRENAGNFIAKLYGYNYDELSLWADSLKSRLLNYRRIKEVHINSALSWYKDDYEEFSFVLDKKRLAQKELFPNQIFSAINQDLKKEMWVGSVFANGERENIKVFSKQHLISDIWALRHRGREIDGKLYRLNEFSKIEKEQASQEIRKQNQEYTLFVQFDYIGSHQQGENVLTREIDNLNKEMSLGYRAEKSTRSWWREGAKQQYWLIFLLIVIIFFISSILFNSLKQPLAVIAVIPISFTGVFLVSYLFDLNFDQGGFAAFFLLAGITVNASIYILNEYNVIRKQKPLLNLTQAYVKAWNRKIMPISLTVISTILGFIPFIVGTKEAFWFPLGTNVIGGLIMSVLGIFILLPILVVKKEKKKN